VNGGMGEVNGNWGYCTIDLAVACGFEGVYLEATLAFKMWKTERF
jgi:hypothetical protein